MGCSSPIVFIELAGLYTGCENPGADTPLAVIKDGVCLDVSAAAYRSGVRLNMTRRQAALTCPSLIFAGYCEGKYAEPSRRFFEALYRHSPLVEPVGYHRAFMELPGAGGVNGINNVDSTLREIVAELSGLAFIALVGVGGSKLVARAAVMMSVAAGTAATATGMTEGTASNAARAEPGIELHITRIQAEKEFLEQLPVSFLWRVPEEVRCKLDALGIHTVGRLGKISQLELVKQFGRIGYELSRLAAGLDNDPVKQAYPPPALTIHTTFEGGAGSTEIIEKRLGAVCARLSEELRAMGCTAGRLRLEVTLAGGKKLTASRVFPYRRCSPESLEAGARACFSKMTIPSPIEEMTITADNLGKTQNVQARLPLDRPRDPLRDPLRDRSSTITLEQAISALSGKYKKDVIARGGLKPSRREMLLSIWDPVRIRGGGMR
ncbi:MAG: DNA polymerase Y family protein [Ignavibacteriales bacterium]